MKCKVTCVLKVCRVDLLRRTFAWGGNRADQRKNPNALRIRVVGGTTQTRTGGKAFAELCLTTWLWCHSYIILPNNQKKINDFDIFFSIFLQAYSLIFCTKVNFALFCFTLRNFALSANRALTNQMSDKQSYARLVERWHLFAVQNQLLRNQLTNIDRSPSFCDARSV